MNLSLVSLVFLAVVCAGRLYFSKNKGVQILAAFEAMALTIAIITTQF